MAFKLTKSELTQFNTLIDALCSKAEIFEDAKKETEGEPSQLMSSLAAMIVVINEAEEFRESVAERLRNEFEDMGMHKAPDNEGYFMYNPNLRAYVEVMSYDKLLKGAKQRNRVLFEKLNITE